MSDRSGVGVIEELTALIVSQQLSHPLRVAIDGLDAAGKTHLADALVEPIRIRQRPVIRASIDGFHNPPEVRYQRGGDSPEGYYLDSFDYDILRRILLAPLGPNGDRKYISAVYNYRVEAPINVPSQLAPRDAILLFDGVFLLCPSLIDYWDFSIFVDVDFDVSVSRALAREVAFRGANTNLKQVRMKYKHRYIPGQKIYLDEVDPKSKADVVLLNNDWETPILIKN